jgi:arylsulfatase A-like enzyme
MSEYLIPSARNPHFTMTRPNIVQIVTDQQHPDLIGALGRLPVSTPNLDRLCAEGTAFTRAYTPCPLCTPARACMVTGQYPSTHGAWTIGTSLKEQALSLPRLLAASGYHTGIIGKSHLQSCHDPASFEALPHIRDWDFFQSWSGPWYGFDEARISIGHSNEAHAYGMHYGLWLRAQGIPPEPPYFARADDADNYGAYGTWALPEACHSGAWIAEETEGFLKRHLDQRAGQPFYLSLNFPDPHLPFRVPERWRQMYQDVDLPPPIRREGEASDKPSLYQATLDGSLNSRGWNERFFVPNQFAGQQACVDWTAEEVEKWRIYLGMTSLLDSHVGRILDTLDTLNLTDNTLLVFTSDHGEYMGHHWLWSKGGSHYDQAVRVPFLVRWPGQVPAGQSSEALQSLIDLPTTFLAAAGLAPHPAMEGLDQTSTWQNPDRAVREQVLIDHRVEQGLHVHSLITDTHRLSVHQYADGSPEERELYDFKVDPDELENRAGEGASVEAELRAEIERIAPKRSSAWPPRTAGA